MALATSQHIVREYLSDILGNSGLPIVEALNHHPKNGRLKAANRQIALVHSRVGSGRFSGPADSIWRSVSTPHAMVTDCPRCFGLCAYSRFSRCGLAHLATAPQARDAARNLDTRGE